MKYVVGLMSGTSLDGIDAALVKIAEGDPLNIELVQFTTLPVAEGLRQEVLACCDQKTGRVDRICRLNFSLAEESAKAVEQVVEKAGLTISQLDLIGSHGQTIYHDVQDQAAISTLQIGCAGVITERTGITTVSNFRVRDIAAGGEGAPLVPYVDQLLYSSRHYHRVLQNIGGIGNYTYLPAGGGKDDVRGTDTGPGNMLIDGVISILTGNQLKYDRAGNWAARGQVSSELLAELMQHPFILKKAPKTTGREEFGLELAQKIISRSFQLNLTEQDAVATVTAFTALSIVDAYLRYLKNGINQIILGGGGSYNPTLVKMIKEYSRQLLEGSPQVLTQEELGYSSEAKEAIAFAVLAYQTMKGRANNVPGATGAQKRVVLGDITPGKQFYQYLKW